MTPKYGKKIKTFLSISLVVSFLTLGLCFDRACAQEQGDQESEQARESRHQDKMDFWHSLSPEEKQEFKEKYRRFKNLSLPERQEIREKSARFENLSPEQKEKIKNNLEKFHNLSLEQKEEMRERFQRWQNLSEEEKGTIREKHHRFEQLPPEERQQMIEDIRKWHEHSDSDNRYGDGEEPRGHFGRRRSFHRNETMDRDSGDYGDGRVRDDVGQGEWGHRR